jgi:hypothetical protein
MTEWMSDKEAREVLKIALASLKSWRATGVVHSFRIYCAHDDDTCDACNSHAGNIGNIERAYIAVTLPPFPECSARRCRCYFRPEDISV